MTVLSKSVLHLNIKRNTNNQTSCLMIRLTNEEKESQDSIPVVFKSPFPHSFPSIVAPRTAAGTLSNPSLSVFLQPATWSTDITLSPFHQHQGQLPIPHLPL